MKQITFIFTLALMAGCLFHSTANAVTTVDNVIKDPTDIPAPIKRLRTASVTVNLEPKEVLADIDGSGVKALVWTYNSTIPGPMVRVMEGDTVTVNLINDAENAKYHNVDFHAAMAPGGGAVSTSAAPGQTKTFTFTASRQGTYVYHCAGEGKAWSHIAHGMYGLIVVEPRGGLQKVDHEFYIGQNEWYHTPPLDGSELDLGLPAGTLMLDESRALLENPTFVSFNGHKNAIADPLLFGNKMHATEGDTVRFFFTSGGPNVGSNWHIIGTIFDKTYQGHFKDFLRNQETEYVAPGSAATFELTAPTPGRYLIVDHAIYRVSNGALGYLIVDAKGSNPL
ncbi:MAG: multicopper oxidase domain-containing protein [Methylovulum sp.]|nr:multicopper oxidase domain-containing protein [Methylovulum sp.]